MHTGRNRTHRQTEEGFVCGEHRRDGIAVVKGTDSKSSVWFFKHLQIRAKEFNGIELTKEKFMELLKECLASADIDNVKADMASYVIDRHELDIWSNDYFLQLADMIRFAE